MNIKHGAADQSITFVLVDADGVEATGLTITDLDIVYARDRAAAVKADLTALSAVTDAHSDNKAIEIDATNAPGLYRVDFPDAAFASGVDRVQLIINGAAIKPAVIEVELVAKLVSDLNDAAAAPSAADIKTALEAEGSHLALVLAKANTLPENPAAQAKLDTLEARLTAARAGYLDKLNVAGTLAHSDAANTYKADVSALATSAEIADLNDFNPASDEVKANVVKWRDEQPNALATGKVQADAAVSLGEEDIESIAEATAAEVGESVAAGVWAAEDRSLTDKANFTLHAAYDAAKTAAQAGDEMDLVDTPNSTAIASIRDGLPTDMITALKASTGWTAGNTMTLAKAIKVLLAFAAGKWQDGTSGYDVLDAEDGATKVMNITPSLETPQKTVVIE